MKNRVARFALIVMCGGMVSQTTHADILSPFGKAAVSLAVGGVSGLVIQQTGKVAANLGGVAMCGVATLVAHDMIAKASFGTDLTPLAIWASALTVGGVAGYTTAQVLEASANIGGLLGGSAIAVGVFCVLD